MPLQEDDPRDDLVGVMHFLDRFLALLLGEPRKTPVFEKPVVQPVLVDGAELQEQRLVKPLDDLLFALHDALLPYSARSPRTRSRCETISIPFASEREW